MVRRTPPYQIDGTADAPYQIDGTGDPPYHLFQFRREFKKMIRRVGQGGKWTLGFQEDTASAP
ncbi:MAG: hypothetical protein GY820_47875 [Gammaproteobacteria bacterium]|nr:hypothetical protein [Gammaproteobacteria bacterium]